MEDKVIRVFVVTFTDGVDIYGEVMTALDESVLMYYLSLTAKGLDYTVQELDLSSPGNIISVGSKWPAGKHSITSTDGLPA